MQICGSDVIIQIFPDTDHMLTQGVNGALVDGWVN